MKRIIPIMTLASVLACGGASAEAPAPGAQTSIAPSSLAPEPVDSFNTFGRFDSWRVVDRDTLIVWVTPARPYLIKLRRPSPRLRFAQAIGISSTVGKVHARLDQIYVDGWPYQIEAIHRLTREQARSWTST